MSNKHITEIGEIDSINGYIISVKISDSIKSNIPILDGIVYRIGQVGNFVKIPLGYATIFGIVTQIGASAIPENIKELKILEYEKYKNTQWFNIVLVGEQIGKKFERGVSQYPATGDKVHIVTIKDLEIIYGGYNDNNSIVVGNVSNSINLDARIDLDKLLSRHCAILGSTGSGKSNSVAIILSAIAEKGFKSARILVIDPHGEYKDVFKDKSKIFKINVDEDNDLNINNLFIPFWALPYNEMLSIFSGTLNDKQSDYLMMKIIEKKQIINEKLKLNIQKEAITADTPIPFSLKQLWFELDDFERQTFNISRDPNSLTNRTKVGNARDLISNEYPPARAGGGSPFLNNEAQGIIGFLNSVRHKLLDNRYNFLFNPGIYNPDNDESNYKDLNHLLIDWIGGDKSITILDLSGIPSTIMQTISGTLLKIIFDALFWGQNLIIGGKEQPLLIVLEEAHNYLKAGENSISSQTVQTIAKEGRKYGVGLLLATQRPSELDDTVLSQCGTIIALRMNNSNDRGHIKASVQDELQGMIDLLPSIRTGEAIITGEAVKIPSRVKFFKTTNAPKSSDPIASEKWLDDKINKESEYKNLVNLWRNQKFLNKEKKNE